MTKLQLVLAPDPIFKKKSEPVQKVDDKIRKLMDDMLDTLKAENGIGMAAPMVDVLKRVVVIDMPDENLKLFMANPEILEKSDESQVHQEASLCFPGISADIKRPKFIKVKYLDYLSKLKRDTLMRKMSKFVKKHVQGHVCSSDCNH
jgi:peptide deformylase